MIYLYITIGFLIAHIATKKYAVDIVTAYISEARTLYDLGQFTDGCTTPFKSFIHRYLSRSHVLCAAHDYGGLGLLTTARAGWHNNLITWLAHMSQNAPIYWVWGTIVALFTLPWVVWRRNWGIKWWDMVGFYVVLFALTATYILIKYQAEITAWTN